MNNFGKLLIILFYADWHEHSINYLEIFKSALKLIPFSDQEIVFNFCDAEKVPEISTKFNINQVPTVIVTDTFKNTIA